MSASHVRFISSKPTAYLLKDRDPVGLSASRSAGLPNWKVLIGRTGLNYIPLIPDPTLSHTNFDVARMMKWRRPWNAARKRAASKEQAARSKAAPTPAKSVKPLSVKDAGEVDAVLDDLLDGLKPGKKERRGSRDSSDVMREDGFR